MEDPLIDLNIYCDIDVNSFVVILLLSSFVWPFTIAMVLVTGMALLVKYCLKQIVIFARKEKANKQIGKDNKSGGILC